jgi:hypothetical protein
MHVGRDWMVAGPVRVNEPDAFSVTSFGASSQRLIGDLGHLPRKRVGCWCRQWRCLRPEHLGRDSRGGRDRRERQCEGQQEPDGHGAATGDLAEYR